MNPHQNGVAESGNRTIMKRVRCMLLASGLEKKFWTEAVATAVKLINKCLSSSIDGDTPNLRWYGSICEANQAGCKGSEVCHVGLSAGCERV